LVDEDDLSKPCEGQRFSPLPVFDASAIKIGPMVLPPAAPPETEKALYVCKASNREELQIQADKLTQGEEVIDFKVEGLTAGYDSESAKPFFLMVLSVATKKDAVKPA
jgi:hypothetical protein